MSTSLSPAPPSFNPQVPLSTRILSLSGFPPELKTRDLQAIFAPWEDEKGGFKIKWVDDVNALVVFFDPAVAKKAYLQTLMAPPVSLMTSTGQPAKIRPYDGHDAAEIISAVQNRGSRTRSSIAGPSSFGGPSPLGNGTNTGSHSSSSPSAGIAAVPGLPPIPSVSTLHLGDNHNGPSTGIHDVSPKRASARLTSGPPSSFTPTSLASNNAGGPPTTTSSLGHRRNPSGSNSALLSASLPAKPVAAAMFDALQGGPSPARHLANAEKAERAAAVIAAQEAVETVAEEVAEEVQQQQQEQEEQQQPNGKGDQAEASDEIKASSESKDVETVVKGEEKAEWAKQ